MTSKLIVSCNVLKHISEKSFWKFHGQTSTHCPQMLGPILSHLFIQCLKAAKVTNIIGFQFQLSKVNGFSDKI